jgi:hypothetical protein
MHVLNIRCRACGIIMKASEEYWSKLSTAAKCECGAPIMELVHSVLEHHISADDVCPDDLDYWESNA